MKLHLASHLDSQLPICGRLLSRDGLLSFRDQRSMQVTTQVDEVKCRHCLRAIGLLPPIGRRAYLGEEADLEMPDEELLAALEEGEE